MDTETIVKLFTLEPATAILALFATALLSGVAAYLGAYLGEKAKHRALQEDIEKVVRATEDIRTQVAGGFWLDQEKWKLKRDAYVPLLEYHLTVHERIDEALGSPDPWSRFREIQREEARRLDLVRSRVAGALAVSPVVHVEKVEALDKALRDLELDKTFWQKRRPQERPGALEQYQAIVQLSYKAEWDRLARTAAGDLEALTAEERKEFERQEEQRVRERRVLDDARQGKELSPEDSALLRSLIPPKDPTSGEGGQE